MKDDKFYEERRYRKPTKQDIKDDIEKYGKCPWCGTSIKGQACFCGYCKADFPPYTVERRLT